MSKPQLPRNDIIAVLDIGSSKVACFVARINRHSAETSRQETKGRKHPATTPDFPAHYLPESFQILGVGYQLSKGIKGGIITDVEEAETSIIAAIHAAEQMAGVNIEQVIVGVTLPDMRSRHLRVELSLGTEPVREREIADIMKEGYDNVMPDEYLLHCHPYSFALDNLKGIDDPTGMLGDKLIADLLIVTAPANLIRNMRHCIHRCQLEVVNFVASPFASALATLTQDEKLLGATLVDIGGGATGYSVFHAGKLVHIGCLPVGAKHITHDVAVGLSTSMHHAERIKTMHGSAIISPADDKVMIEVPQLGQSEEEEGNTIARSYLNQIIKPRLEEIFELLRDNLNDAGIAKMAGTRLVLTGGGSQLIGIGDMASRILQKQVRVARTQQIDGLGEAVSGPAFAGVLGLIHFVMGDYRKQQWLRSRSPSLSFKQVLRFLKEAI